MKKEERSTDAIGVGQRLATARKALGLQQNVLASKLGVSPTVLSNYENGYAMFPAELVAKLFLITGIDSNYLYQAREDGLPRPLQNALDRLRNPRRRA